MADGTISFEEGLGFKALDSNEIRRRLKGAVAPLTTESIVTSPNLEFVPGNPNIKKLMSDSSSQLRTSIPENPTYISPTGVQSGSPSSEIAPKLQRTLFQESLIVEAEERARQAHH